MIYQKHYILRDLAGVIFYEYTLIQIQAVGYQKNLYLFSDFKNN